MYLEDALLFTEGCKMHNSDTTIIFWECLLHI